MAVQIYGTWRAGNEVDGPDGSDTVFIVRARDHRRAAEIADVYLAHTPHAGVQSWCCGVYPIGVSHPLPEKCEDTEKLLAGPIVQSAYGAGPWASWRRDEQEGPWLLCGPCPRCGFEIKEGQSEGPLCGSCGWDRSVDLPG